MSTHADGTSYCYEQIKNATIKTLIKLRPWKDPFLLMTLILVTINKYLQNAYSFNPMERRANTPSSVRKFSITESSIKWGVRTFSKAESKAGLSEEHSDERSFEDSKLPLNKSTR